IEPDTRIDLISNRLVVVAHRDRPLILDRLEEIAVPRIRRIAIGDPDGVPAGIYARLILTELGLWEAVRDRLIPALNVRAALAFVETEQVDLGLVYRTDAAVSSKVRIVYEFPDGIGPKIIYPAAVVRGSSEPQIARAFLTFLTTPEATAIFRRFGFITLHDEEPEEGR
ncbi:MAG: molybdate ABC transporter substrate-binding protein, partial [Candidatus Bipolaricaulia bacterium]